MTSQLRSRDPEFPLLVEDEHLVVRGRDGNVVRLPLAGDGAVAALAHYRYTTSLQSSQRSDGTATWSGRSYSRRAGVPVGVGGFTGGSQRRNPLSYEAGVARGKWWQRSFVLEWELGTVALDRSGKALLRMRPLRGRRKVRRVAGACGLEFIEEQVTDPEQLGQAPEVITRPLLGTGANRMISAVSLVLAFAAGLAVFATVGDGSFADPDAGAVAAGVVTLLFARELFRWPLRWIGEKIATR